MEHKSKYILAAVYSVIAFIVIASCAGFPKPCHPFQSAQTGQSHNRELSMQIVHGVIKDNAGNPVPNAHVIVKKDKSGTCSDSLGRFHLLMPRGGGWVIVEKEGFLNQKLYIESR